MYKKHNSNNEIEIEMQHIDYYLISFGYSEFYV